jgi:hypothetical protein
MMPVRVNRHGTQYSSDLPHRIRFAQQMGFDFQVRADGSVVITHHGRVATTLRGQRAEAFLAEVEGGDGQELMARVTGNYKHGNERQARNHPRNRNR